MIDIGKLDEMFVALAEMTDKELKKAKEKGYFSKDLAEAVAVVLSIGYMRVSKNGDK